MKIEGVGDKSKENKEKMFNHLIEVFTRLYWDDPNSVCKYNVDNTTGNTFIFIKNSEKYVIVDTENHVEV